MERRFWSIGQVAKFTYIPVVTIRKWCNLGWVTPFTSKGARRYFSQLQVLQIMNLRYGQPAVIKKIKEGNKKRRGKKTAKNICHKKY